MTRNRDTVLLSKMWFWLAFVLGVVAWAGVLIEGTKSFWEGVKLAPWAVLLSVAAGIGYKRIKAMGGWK